MNDNIQTEYNRSVSGRNNYERSQVEKEIGIESEHRRRFRIESYGRDVGQDVTTNRPPAFSPEYRSRWAAARDEIAIERLFK